MDEELYDEFGNYIGPDIDDNDDDDDEGLWDGHTPSAADNELDEREERQAEINANDIAEDDDIQLQPQQVVMYHDKNYFPDASEVYPDAETLVQDEDTQPLETPIIAPVEDKCFEKVERERPETTFDFKFLAGLMDHPALIRNVAVVGHLHHGKTALFDMLIRETQVREWNPGKEERYTDTRLDEQERGLSLKAVPISLVLEDLRGKSYLLNLIDSPGHVNFIDEQACSMRLADGVIVVVDVIEGVSMVTELALKAAVRQRLPVILLINKVDRLILELKLPPADAYHALVHTVEGVNSVLTASGYHLPRLSPTRGDVVFASAFYSWCFTLPSFAAQYTSSNGDTRSSQRDMQRAAINNEGKELPSDGRHAPFTSTRFAQKLWGDFYMTQDGTRIVSGDKDKSIATSGKRTFVQFILEPLYKVYSHVIGCDPVQLTPLLYEIGVTLKKRELCLDPKLLLRLVLDRFFGASRGFVDAIVTHIPSPVDGARNKVEHTYTGELSTRLAKSMLRCGHNVETSRDREEEDYCDDDDDDDDDNVAPVMVNICKLIPRSNGVVFDAFGRVLSGTVRIGDRVRVLREGFSLDDEEDMSVRQVTKIWVLEARYRVEVNCVRAGNWALFEGLDSAISKTATLTSMSATVCAEACIFKPLRFDALACVKVAIEPINPSELPKMLDGLRKISQSYPMALTKVEDSGEHIILGSGELYLDCILHDLRRMYSHIEIKVADPVACFSETVIDTSSIKCFAETPNKASKLTMIAEPLEQGLAADIEAGTVKLSWDKDRIATFFEKKYDWDVLASRTVWSFGPDSDGPNVLIDDTLASSEDPAKKLLYSVRNSLVQGFQWASREGPLCDEPIRNVKFKILEANIATQPIQRGGGQIIPTSRRVAYSAFLLATPRLMEPVCSVQIQTPADCISAIYKVLARRRGHVAQEAPQPGSPLFSVLAYVPVLDSFGFETDLRTHTQGQAFCMSNFDHWSIVPGDPLDKSIVLNPLEPSPPAALARELIVKTRRRKGLSEDVSINKFFDDPMLLQLAKQSADLELLQER